MSKEQKIKHDLEEIWYTLIHAKNAFYYTEYLFNPPTEKEAGYMRHYGTEMLFFRTVLWRNSIIEISKLFKKSEKRTIEKLLNKLSGGGLYSNLIQSEIIEKWRDKFYQSYDIITKVIKLRDEVFAHTDIDYKETHQYNKFEKDVESLIVLVEEFITDMFLQFDAAVVHTPKLLKDNFEILNVLADYEENKHNEVMSQYIDIIKNESKAKR